MKKIVLVSMLLLNLNVFAAVLPHDFTSTKQNDHTKVLKTSLVYGGQDISRPRVAIANETVWGTDKVLIG